MEVCDIDLRIILGGTSRYIDSGITRPIHFFVTILSFAYYSVACIHNFFLTESIKTRKTMTVSLEPSSAYVDEIYQGRECDI